MEAVRLREELLAKMDAADRTGLDMLIEEVQPADLAAAARAMDLPERVRLLMALPDEPAARLMEELEFAEQGELLTQLPEARARAILNAMASDDIVDMLGDLPRGQSEEILDLMPEDSRQEIEELMDYPENTAGGWMTPEYVSIPRTMTAQEALEYLRTAAPDAETIYYLYVTDDENHLLGVLSLRQLIVADPQQPVEEIMYRRVISVPVDMDQEEVARVLNRYDFLAVPVVDHQNVLLGVITVDDVMDVVSEEVSEDIQRLGGAEPLDQPYFSAGVGTMVSKRISWLLVLFLAQSLTGTILAHFERELAAVIALAFFIPLLTGTAGNAGSQAATLIIRSMAVGEVHLSDLLRVLRRELVIGAVLGSVMAVLAFLRAWLMGEPADLGYTVALTVLVIVVVGAMLGGALPLVVRRLSLDPAVASGPVITTLCDATGLVIYFHIARWIMGI